MNIKTMKRIFKYFKAAEIVVILLSSALFSFIFYWLLVRLGVM